LPNFFVATGAVFSCHRVPPPFTRVTNNVVKYFLYFIFVESLCPQQPGIRFREKIFLVCSHGTYRIVGVYIEANLFDFTLNVIFPGTPNADFCNEIITRALEVVGNSSKCPVIAVNTNINTFSGQVRPLNPFDVFWHFLDIYFIVLDLTI
jgi:hypothetical protein